MSSVTGERRIEFINALRSGEFNKGLKTLKRRTKTKTYHCAWGVGCEVFHKHNPDTSQWTDSQIPCMDVKVFFSVNNDDVYSSLPPFDVQDFFGLSDYACRTIMELNDKTISDNFDEIADWMESYNGGWGE